MKSVPKVSLQETLDAADLRVFVKAAELLSVTRTAQVFGVSKSKVSKTLAALEEHLGCALLERTSRRVEITPAGQLLFERASSVLLELDRLSGDVRELTNVVRGQLTIAAPPDLGALLTADLFARFLASYPEVRLALRLDYGYVDLQDPSLDVGIRIGGVQDDRLVARKVGHVERILLASPRFAHSRQLHTPQDLATCPALVFAETTAPLRWSLTNERGKKAAVTVAGPLAARSFPTLLRAAEAHLGVALVPELLAQEALRSKRLVNVLPAWRQLDAPILLVHRVGQQKLRRVRAFLDFFKNELSAAPLSVR